ncbi:phospho-acceptor domain-containing protein [Litorimonas taeanensis]|uniref:histidine kinase n=1 Tax=Litorimonas taeanensis TaxID=568099 RepID=A0A420WEN0_9PROT|nr:ATP-binding protein [Litorimonas taeanensis]RKQ69395.1 phospho-acceptor domain-containing protein [Litorimonas taeanensis]
MTDAIPRPELEIESLKSELEALTEEFQDFAYIVSHDLSGPLRHAAGFAEMVLSNNRDTLDEKSKRHLNHIITSAHSGRETLEQLREYSRLNTREQVIEDNVESAELINTAQTELAALIETQQAEIHYDTLPIITCDKTRLSLVFKNIIENGLTYHNGPHKPVIEIIGHEGEDYWTFTITDNGMGVPKKNEKDIFRVFRRAVENEDFPGEGMGLPYAKKAIQKHKGQLWLEKTSENGSTFCFTISKHLMTET